MNQWTKCRRIFELINGYAKEYKKYDFWYMNNHELKFSIGNNIFIITFNPSINEYIIRIENPITIRRFSHYTYGNYYKGMNLAIVFTNLIKAYMAGESINE